LIAPGAGPDTFGHVRADHPAQPRRERRVCCAPTSTTPTDTPRIFDLRCAALLAANPSDRRRLRLAVRRGVDLRRNQGLSWKARVILLSLALYLVLFLLFVALGGK
jgi:hypothetical protein